MISINEFVKRFNFELGVEKFLINVEMVSIYDLKEISIGQYVPFDNWEILLPIKSNFITGVISSHKRISDKAKPIFEIYYGDERITGQTLNVSGCTVKLKLIGFLEE